MDFITDLPLSKDTLGNVYNSLFVIINRLTKIAKYIPCLKTINANKLTQVYLD
jgi:hypothetical protein